MSVFTLVYCALKDCIHHAPDPEKPERCRCSHPEKPGYMTAATCALYRVDWQKKLKTNQDIVQKSHPKKRDKLPQDF